MSEHIRYERSGPVAEIVIDRPEKRNALSLAMWKRIPELLGRAAEDSSVRVLIVHGGPSASFAAGADISEFEEAYRDEETAAATSRTIGDAVAAVENCAKPVLAAIDGSCVGGGVSLALAADIRLASPKARFGVTPGKLGLLYSPADTRRLVEAVGVSSAKDLLFTGRIVTAHDARQMGLIDRLVEDDQALPAARSLAMQTAELSQWSVQATKKMIRGLWEGKSDTNPEAMKLFLSGFTGEDFREGYRAFLEKRKPNFPFR